MNAYEGIDNNERIWKHLAYAARYGHQPLPILRSMTWTDLNRFTGALSSLVKEEQTPPPPGFE